MLSVIVCLAINRKAKCILCIRHSKYSCILNTYSNSSRKEHSRIVHVCVQVEVAMRCSMSIG